MSRYKLYKEANRSDDENRRQAMLHALVTLGGGGLGYLLTRYGLGLKGAGAGIAGAGLGAVAGAGAGAMMNRMSKDQQEKDLRFKISQGEAMENAGINPTERAFQAINPVNTGSGDDEAGELANVMTLIGGGGAAGLRLLQSLPDKTIDKMKEAQWHKMLGKGHKLDDVFEVAGKDVKFAKGGESTMKRLLRSGVDKSKIDDLLEAMAPTQKSGLTKDMIDIGIKKHNLARPLMQGAKQLDSPSLARVAKAKVLKALPHTALGATGFRFLGEYFDAFTKQKGSQKYVDSEGNPY